MVNAQIKVVTEQFPPYNYQEGGEVIGLSTLVVREVFNKLGEPFEPEVVPWVRALVAAEKTPDTLIYSIGRIPERESKYQWVGVIAPAKNYVFKHADDDKILIKSLKDVKQYRIVTFKESVREQYFEGKGFEKGKHIVSVYDYGKALKLFTDRKVELWAMNELVAHYHVKKAGLSVRDTLKPVFLLEEISPEGYYMAFGNKTSSEVVQKFRQALEALKKDGTYQNIIETFVNGDGM